MPRTIRTFASIVLPLAFVLTLSAQEQLLKPQTVRFDGTQEYKPEE